MVTEPDLKQMRDRIIAILQADTTLYDKNRKGLKGKVRRFLKGIPNDLPSEFPTIVIYPGKPFVEKSFFGSDAYYNKIRWKLRLYVSDAGGDHEKMQDDMLTLHKAMVEALENNEKLTDPDDANDTTGLAKLTRAEITEPIDPLIVRETRAIIDGLETTFLIEKTNN